MPSPGNWRLRDLQNAIDFRHIGDSCHVSIRDGHLLVWSELDDPGVIVDLDIGTLPDPPPKEFPRCKECGHELGRIPNDKAEVPGAEELLDLLALAMARRAP